MKSLTWDRKQEFVFFSKICSKIVSKTVKKCFKLKGKEKKKLNMEKRKIHF